MLSVSCQFGNNMPMQIQNLEGSYGTGNNISGASSFLNYSSSIGNAPRPCIDSFPQKRKKTLLAVLFFVGAIIWVLLGD